MRNYCYKVCYRQLGKDKIKMYAVTNTYDLALWFIRWYEREPPKDKTEQPIVNVEWLIVPIKNYIEYRRLWRGCPFEQPNAARIKGKPSITN